MLRLLEAPCLARRRIHDAHAVQQSAESLAVLGKVDGVGLRAHDLHAGIGERAGQLERGLAAERHHHAVGALHINDIHDILVGKRLEVQPVGRVVVGGDGFGVAVHHDGLEAAARQRVARVHAAVVELDALTNTVGPRAQNHHLGLVRAGYLVCRNATTRVGRYPHEALVGLVVILRCARKLRGARIDGLHAGNNAETLAIGPNEALVAPGELRDLGIARAVLLEQAHGVGIDVLHAQAPDVLLHGDHVGDARDEPRIDAGELVHALVAPSATERLGEREDAVLGG